MGLDPGFPIYDAGTNCTFCEDVLFGGVTPKYIQAFFSDVVSCPGFVIGPPDGAFLMTQQIPCRWIHTGVTYLITLEFTATNSVFSCRSGSLVFYQANMVALCDETLGNILTCGPPLVQSSGGAVVFNWGPDIHP